MAAQDPSIPQESNATPLVATASAFLVASWIAVMMRAYVRVVMLKNFKTDDCFLLVAQMNYTISCTFILIGVHFGVGRHNKSLSQSHEIEALKYQSLATATYISDMMFIKLSIGVFLLRLATQKRYRYTLYGSLFVVATWSLVMFFWNMFQCYPVAAQWDYRILQADKTAWCASGGTIVNIAYSVSALSILSDWFYALIPIPMIWNVKMTKQAKATVMFILGMGILASLAPLIRLQLLAALQNLDDILYTTTNTMVWTLIEPGIAIIASCLATIRPLLRAWKFKGFQSSENNKQSDNVLPYGRAASGIKSAAYVNIEAGQGRRENATTEPVHLGLSIERGHSHVSLQGLRTSKLDQDRFRQSEPGSLKNTDGEEFVVQDVRPERRQRSIMYEDAWATSQSATSSIVELTAMQPLRLPSDPRVETSFYRP